MMREKQPQDIDLKTDLIPALGMPYYLVRVFRDLELDQIRDSRGAIGLNSLALISYNFAVGFGLDHIIQNYS